MGDLDVPLDDAAVPLDGLNVSLDVPSVLMDDLSDPLDELSVQVDGSNVPKDLLYEQLDDDHSHIHHHLQLCGHILGTHRTANARSRMGHMGDEADLGPDDALLVHPSLATQIVILIHNQHHSHCNSHPLLRCSLPSLNRILVMQKPRTSSMDYLLGLLHDLGHIHVHFAFFSSLEDEGSVLRSLLAHDLERTCVDLHHGRTLGSEELD